MQSWDHCVGSCPSSIWLRWAVFKQHSSHDLWSAMSQLSTGIKNCDFGGGNYATLMRNKEENTTSGCFTRSEQRNLREEITSSCVSRL